MDQLIEEFARWPPTALGGAILAFLFVWAVLMFLMPFFVYGASRRAKQISQKMDELIEIQRGSATAPRQEEA